MYDFLYRARSFLSEARPLIGIICFLAVPVFAIFAYRAWSKTLRAQLSPWRSKAAVTSIVAVSANWFYVILILLLHFVNDRWASSLLNEASWDVVFFLAIAAALLAIALKGLARVQGVAAGVLMAAFWLSTIVA